MGGTVPPEVIDDDNEEEEARIEARRRSKSKSKNNTKANKAAEDVEELLLEQVEREREDKLCVICQDQEKCIMILPCRHLCICATCQTNLLRRNNHAHSRTCHICRRHVKQMIKAYL